MNRRDRGISLVNPNPGILEMRAANHSLTQSGTMEDSIKPRDGGILEIPISKGIRYVKYANEMAIQQKDISLTILFQ